MSYLALKFDSKVLISIALLCFVGLLLRLYNFLIGNPRELRSKLKKQGINGPPPTLLLGNIREIKKALSSTAKPPPSSSSETPLSHDCASILFPHLKNWREQYGQVFMLSLGNTQILYVDQPDVVRHISICKSLELGKPSNEQNLLGPLLGRGILTSNGTIWAHQRDVFAPELYMDKVKGMMNIISECAISVLNSWSSRIDAEHGSADINIDGYMRSFSGDVISRACFGSNSSKGEEIFLKLRELRSKISLSSWIPGMRYLPTKTNREAWRLEKEVKDLIMQVVKERKGSAVKNEKDLLQMVLEGAKKSNLGQEGPDRLFLDNCTNIYLAGYETTAVAATWCLMLLASNQQWQARVRYEVQEICQGRIPDSDMLRKMKQRLRSKLKKQGINGPPPTLLLGNIREVKKARSSTAKPPPSSSSETPLSHDCASILFPHLKNWREQYDTIPRRPTEKHGHWKRR